MTRSATPISAAVKTELCQAPIPALAPRRAELAAALRFGGGLRVEASRVVIEVEVDTGEIAARLCRAIEQLHGHTPDTEALGGGARHTSRHVLRLVRGAHTLARQTGLLDPRDRPVRGLPPPVVAGGLACAEAVWRGAFLTRGTLAEPGRAPAAEVLCPGPEAALALAGAARRLHIPATAGHSRGLDRVVVRDPDAIATLLARIGAPRSAQAWTQQQHHRAAQARATRAAAFDSANARRSAAAAAHAAARARHAMDLLGADLPPELAAAARLRTEHPHASLQQLGALATPPMTKDAIAGRIRRLLELADRHTTPHTHPDTDRS